ncbi:MAG: N-acetylmuramoyl-L-alanine amidase [Chitinophagales bacterium]|nr:N-acetylmuramoyl-L-alanine amidase [Chitinophagales bacterium]MDW8427436.1 N-acetylmuramoyl-L-alanine amidase [Chitinophagales bacterium]
MSRCSPWPLAVLLAATVGLCAAFAQSSFNIRTIVLDAGHGGHDSGCRGLLAVEKDITLQLALLTEQMLKEALPDLQIILTRRSDVFVPLHERAHIANKHRADLFVSIHCNASKSPAPFGTETYLMGLHVSDENLEVSLRENSVITLENNYESHYEGFDPNAPETFIVLSMNQNAYMTQSIQLASLIEKEFSRLGRHSRGVKQAGFLVLWRVTMPAVLVEVGFLSNRHEERFLASQHGQRLIASALAQAIINYKQQVENTLPDRETQSLPVSNSSPHQPPGFDTPDTSFYRIQLFASASLLPRNDARLQSLDDSLFIERSEKGLYRYLVGNFPDASSAQSRLAHYRSKGFNDAFLVTYRNGLRIQEP